MQRRQKGRRTLKREHQVCGTDDPGNVHELHTPDKTKKGLFEVFLDGRSLELVWREGSVWYADPNSTANPLVTAEDKAEAVEELLDELGL